MATQVGSIYYDLDLDDKDFNKKVDGVSGKIESLVFNFDKAQEASKLFAVGLAAVGAAGIGAATFGIKMAAQLETMTQGFVTLLGSTQKANAAIAMIKKDAATTPFELPGLISANQLLTAVTKDATKSERLLLNLGKALTAMGRGQPELDRIIINLQQIGSVGHAATIDVKQFAFAGIPIYDMLAKATGKTGEALQDMITSGQITFDLLEKMFNAAGEGSGRFAKAFQSQGGTFNQVLSNFKDNIGIIGAELVKQFGIFDLAKAALQGLTDALTNLAKPETIAAIKQFFVDNQQYLPIVVGIIVGGLTPAVIALATSFGILALSLAPYIAAGAALGFIIVELNKHHQEWADTIMNKLKPALDFLSPFVQFMVGAFKDFANAIVAVVVPAFHNIVLEIQTYLLPSLQRFWEAISPVLIPVLKFLGVVIFGAVIGALVALTGALWVVVGAVQVISDVIGGAIALMSKLVDMSTYVANKLKEKFSYIGDIAGWLGDKLKALNPFEKHSPSLVENVIKGVDVIKKQYASLGEVTLPNANMMVGLNPNYNALQNGGGVNQNITINVDKVGDMQDVQAIGRELGFRAKLQG